MSWVVDLIRGWLGESADLAHTRAQLAETRAELADARRRVGVLQVAAGTHRAELKQAQADLDQAVAARLLADSRIVQAVLDRDAARADRDAALARAAGADEAIAKAFQPERSPACTKQQLPDRDTAKWWASKVADDLGETADAFTTYRCEWCPRNPLTGNRWWHIGHVDPVMRTSNPAVRRARQSEQLAEKRLAGRALHQRPEVREALLAARSAMQ